MPVSTPGEPGRRVDMGESGRGGVYQPASERVKLGGTPRLCSARASCRGPPDPSPYTPGPVSQRKGLGCLFEIVETIVLTILIFWVIQTFVAQPYKVQQGSMERTLEEGQYVLVDKLTPRWAVYAGGDIIVFEPPENWLSQDRVPFIKRVIGVAGDTVELIDGRVLVNGLPLDEPYVYTVDGAIQDTEPTPGGQTRWVVGDGQLFVMGDHRGNSSDSRTFGPIEVAHVTGRAWLRYWPLESFGPLEAMAGSELAGAAP